MYENSLLSKSDLVDLLKNDKSFRDTFAMEFVKNAIPSQLRALRQERGWTQEDLGLATGKPRNVITRLENPNSNIPNIATMLEVATGCGAALLVKIVPFSKLLKEYDASFRDQFAPSVDSEAETLSLKEWELIENIVESDETRAQPANALTSSKFATKPVIQVAPPTHTLPILMGVQSSTDATHPPDYREAGLWKTPKVVDASEENSPFRQLKNFRPTASAIAS